MRDYNNTQNKHNSFKSFLDPDSQQSVTITKRF